MHTCVRCDNGPVKAFDVCDVAVLNQRECETAEEDVCDDDGDREKNPKVNPTYSPPDN
jgi:hypothetical protein